MIYDSVMCVSPRHKEIALKAIKSLYLFTESRKIFIITSRNNFTLFRNELDASLPIYLLDEDKIIENVNLNSLEDYFAKRIGKRRRAGWYFQQFLKMSVSNLPEVADYYLIWDSDTILLRSIAFFDDSETVLINPRMEYHKPYFDILKKTVCIDRKVDFSFISEHLMIKKSYMKELVKVLEVRASNEMSWIKLILNSIEDQYLSASGFSEFETYGNFIACNYKDSFKCRFLKSTRCGGVYYGLNPSKHDIFCLMLAGYTFVTFENWHSKLNKPIRVVIAVGIVINKALSRVLYKACVFLHCLTIFHGSQLKAAQMISRSNSWP
jgi:hypothetical protein